MKRKNRQKLNILCDDIESFLKTLPSKEKTDVGIEICKVAATYSIYELEDCDEDEDFNPFAPLGILDIAKGELMEEIDRIMLDVIGDEAAKVAKKEINNN